MQDTQNSQFASNQSPSNKKIVDGFYKALNFLDNFQVKQTLGDIALKVVKNGCYYGVIVPYKKTVVIQELPANYCRTRFKVNGRYVVELNMRFFMSQFKTEEQRKRVLKLFPKDIQKGYVLYRRGKLQGDYPGDKNGWYVLEPGSAIKFNLNGSDVPPFISVIPAIIDLDNAQKLDQQKMQQQLLKIIIQQLPLDKNGELIFDVDEAQALHNNVVKMLARAIGVDVLTTFADVKVEDMAEDSSSRMDELEKVERAIYNQAGVSQMQFNTDGNIALEKSILNDEAAMYNLITQFEAFLNDLMQPFNKSKIEYRVQLLTTTIYNYRDMAKAFKEQTQLGYSKFLPQIALGQSQSSVLGSTTFENDVLDLVTKFIPPMTSNTMNAEAMLARNGQIAEKQGKTSSNSQQKNSSSDSEGPGRKELDDDKKSEKTIQNRESMS